MRQSLTTRWPFLIFIAAFALSVWMRADTLGKIHSDGREYGRDGRMSRFNDGHQWITATTWIFVSNWYDEGLVKLNGRLMMDPPSPEYVGVERGVYVSYSPVFALPVYFIAKAVGEPPAVWMIHAWNLALHFLGALLAGLFVYRALRKYAERWRTLGFLATSLAYIFHPFFMYYLSVVYFADMTILPLFVLILLNLQARERDPENRRLAVWQFFLFLLAALTDWFSVSICLVIVATIAAEKSAQKTRRILETLLPFALGWLSFVALLYTNGEIPEIINRFFERTGIKSNQVSLSALPISLTQVFAGHVGRGATILLVVSFAVIALLHYSREFRAKFKIEEAPISMLPLNLLVLAPTLHTVLLSNHSARHEFSGLKFLVSFCILACGLIPAMILARIGTSDFNRKERGFLYALALAPFLYVGILAPQYFLMKEQYSKNDLGQFYWIKGLIRPTDVVFSNSIVVEAEPPQPLAIMRRKIWRFDNSEGLALWLRTHEAAREASLLWIEKVSDRKISCAERFKNAGASEIAHNFDIVAYRFASVEDFAKMKFVQSNECL